MAEDSTEPTPAAPAPAPAPALDEAKIAEMVRNSASQAVREALAVSLQSQPAQSAQPEPADYFESLIDSRTSSRLAALSLQAESANDRADFYTSRLWTEDIDDYLLAETPEEAKAEKRELKAKIEENFNNLIKQGKGMRREEIAKHAIGDLLTEKKEKYDERVIKRNKRLQDTELEKARGAVNIGQNAVANFNAQDVHSMEYDKVVEKYGELVF